MTDGTSDLDSLVLPVVVIFQFDEVEAILGIGCIRDRPKVRPQHSHPLNCI